MTIFLRNFDVLKHDIITVQKSWHNILQSTIHNSISQLYNLFYVDYNDCEKKKSRVCFFINKRLDIERMMYKTHFKNVISMKITLNNSDSNFKHVIKIHNVYNESKIRFASTLKILKSMLKKNKSHSNDEDDDYVQNVVIENFNIHHSQWNDRDIKANNRNDQFLKLIDQFALQ